MYIWPTAEAQSTTCGSTPIKETYSHFLSSYKLPVALTLGVRHSVLLVSPCWCLYRAYINAHNCWLHSCSFPVMYEGPHLLSVFLPPLLYYGWVFWWLLFSAPWLVVGLCASLMRVRRCLNLHLCQVDRLEGMLLSFIISLPFKGEFSSLNAEEGIFLIKWNPYTLLQRYPCILSSLCTICVSWEPFGLIHPLSSILDSFFFIFSRRLYWVW